MRSIATIGIYGFDRETFLATLAGAKVELLLDVRQRRGVRGSEYAWANSRRLQTAMAEAEIGYVHHKELAPTTELRQILYAADAERGEGKRSRTILDPEFVGRYEREILDRVDLGEMVDSLDSAFAALLCVERDPEACHRSLIAERLHSERGFRVRHLRPPGAARAGA